MISPLAGGRLQLMNLLGVRLVVEDEVGRQMDAEPVPHDLACTTA
jgi:hypothetical protein